MNSEDSALPQETTAIELPVLLLQTCKQVTIAVYKEIYFNNNLKALIVKGNPSEEELQSTWYRIIFEYGSLFKNADSNYLFDLAKRIEELQIDINQTHAIVYCLTELLKLGRTDIELVDQLAFMGYPGDFDYQNVDQCLKDLNRCLSMCKTHEFDLGELKEEYERLNKTATGQRQTEEDFDSNIHTLGRFQHSPLNIQVLSMYDYAIIFNKLHQE